VKVVAILMVIVLVASIGGVGYLFLTANVSVTAVGVVATEAEAQLRTFEELREDLAQDSLTGTRYRSHVDLTDPAGYQFYTYTVRLRNSSMMLCDMVEIQVTPREGDVLQMGSERALSLAPRSTGDVSATVLTTVDSSPVREIIVTYYIWGIPFSIKTTYG